MSEPAPTLLDEIEAFLARADVDLTPTEFGLKAINDGKLIATLKNGRRVWPETADRIRAFIQNYQVEAPSQPTQASAA